MTTREWKNDRGETKNIKTVVVKMTDGVDEFTAEATDALAESLENTPLSTENLYGVQIRISCRESDKDGKKFRWNTLRIVNIQEV